MKSLVFALVYLVCVGLLFFYVYQNYSLGDLFDLFAKIADNVQFAYSQFLTH